MEIGELRTDMVQTSSAVRLNWLDWLSLALVIVGAINWGLVGLGMFFTGEGAIEGWNLVNILLGWSPLLEATIYLLVGLAGLYELYFAYELGSGEQTATRTKAG